jgi:hypothetical protein
MGEQERSHSVTICLFCFYEKKTKEDCIKIKESTSYVY